jgi:hypothetical protein
MRNVMIIRNYECYRGHYLSKEDPEGEEKPERMTYSGRVIGTPDCCSVCGSFKVKISARISTVLTETSLGFFTLSRQMARQ